MTPLPRLPLRLIALLPRDLREPIAGDLEEEWRTSIRPSTMRLWRLVLRSILTCWFGRIRQLFEDRPPDLPHPRGDSAMHSLLQDVRYGLRMMRRSPGFTIAAVATLALGIGANSAIFGLVHLMSFKPLPYEDPQRVAFVLGWDTEEQSMRFNLRLADYLDIRDQAGTLASVAAYRYLSANLTGGDLPERVQAYRVTANTFTLLGVSPAIGRAFTEQDGREGHDGVAVISDGLWRRRFGSDPQVVGRQVTLNGRPHEIVGVMPPRFEFPVFNFKGDLWVPLPLVGAERGGSAGRDGAVVVARLRRDVSPSAANAELDTIMGRLAREYPQTNSGLGVRIVEMGRLDDEQAGPAIAIVIVTVGLVLLLACANVANLLLARGVSRHRELAVRVAVGASRRRIVRQLLIESLLLSLAGGVAGVVLAVIALDAIRAALPEMIRTTMPNIDELGADRITIAFTMALAVLTSIVFGLLPAWRAARPDLQDGLKEAAGAGGGRGTHRLRTALVVAEVALSTLLLVAAGLLARSYAQLQEVSPGFDPSGVLTMTVALPEYKYPDADGRRRFFDEAVERVERLPGVQAAAFVNVLPFSTYDNSTRLVVDGQPLPEPGREPSAGFRVAGDRYFEALRIPFVAGRPFDRRDGAGGLPVAIVSQGLARRFFQDESPIGQRVRLGRGEDSPWRTIVGVVGDVHHWQLTQAPAPQVYVPLAQSPDSMMMLAVRTAGRPEDQIQAARDAILSVDAAQPVYHVKSMEQLLGDSLLPQTTAASLMLIFSGLALLLAGVGVFGVISYGVTQQTREFGVRIALGATRGDLLRLVLRRGSAMVAAGMALGTGAALAVSRLLAGALYGVGPADPLTYGSAIAVLGLVGLLACAVPAWRASRVEPVAALRLE